MKKMDSEDDGERKKGLEKIAEMFTKNKKIMRTPGKFTR